MFSAIMCSRRADLTCIYMGNDKAVLRQICRWYKVVLTKTSFPQLTSNNENANVWATTVSWVQHINIPHFSPCRPPSFYNTYIFCCLIDLFPKDYRQNSKWTGNRVGPLLFIVFPFCSEEVIIQSNLVSTPLSVDI